jgi:CubicO group peptidase (beta-lactamase class C family)
LRKSILDSYNNSQKRNYWPTKHWKIATFEERGIKEEIILKMFEYCDSNDYKIESLLIVKDGYLVLEKYSRGYTAEKLHPVFSVTKSFISALVGIAIKEGYIKSVDQKMLDFFPHIKGPNIDSKKDITIKHLLTWRSGITWNEIDVDTTSQESTWHQMIESPNWVEYVLSLEMDHEAGTFYYPHSGGSHLLSVIIERATGTSTYDYANEHIFGPLGFNNVEWSKDPQGTCFGASGMSLLPRDMAKFGFLYLNKGKWDNTQIIPEEWVQESFKPTTIFSKSLGYGYQWWAFRDIKTNIALGYRGQIIQVTPDQDLVVVITADCETTIFPPLSDIITDYIVKAV